MQECLQSETHNKQHSKSQQITDEQKIPIMVHQTDRDKRDGERG